MNEHQLERSWSTSGTSKFDVLVCTTIVETGLDISNANTLIVDRADTFGLSQLHQLRGRVGRGRERAYAYFLYPPERPLTETAHDRLATIAQHTDLGAGMHVAMKDLEIRGAGNLLGGEQSGHIAGVGFDLYIRLVGEAVARAARRRPGGAGPRSRSSCRSTRTCRTTTCPASGCGWRRTADRGRSRRRRRSTAVRDELVDRYGPLPEPVLNLLEVARLPGPGPAGRPDRRRLPGQPRPSRRSSCPSRAGPAAAAVPQDAAQARGPYDAGAGS